MRSPAIACNLLPELGHPSKPLLGTPLTPRIAIIDGSFATINDGCLAAIIVCQHVELIVRNTDHAYLPQFSSVPFAFFALHRSNYVEYNTSLKNTTPVNIMHQNSNQEH